MKQVDKIFHVYSDGACKVHNGKTGSWAYVILDSHTETIMYEGSGLVKETTSPTMELRAAVEAIGRAWSELPQGEVILHSDSKFVIDGITSWVHKWKKDNWITSTGKPVKQQELWLDFLEVFEKVVPEIIWVKGHAGNKWNEYVDKLATQKLNS